MSVSSWQTCPSYPAAIIIINVTSRGYIVIHIIFWNIIIARVIITSWPPARLTPNIDTNTDLRLCSSRSKKACNNRSRVKQFFHK